jgi:hypothetical protein
VIYQEYTENPVTPATPDLPVLVVGPCNQILDYLDDKEDCYAGAYGEYLANSPLTAPTAVVFASPPNIEPGGVLDADSVSIYLDDAQAVIIENTSAAAQNGVYTSGDNLLVAHNTSGGVHFGSAGVAIGDTLIINGGGVSDTVRVVKELCYTLHDYGGTLDFVTNGVQEGDIVILSNDQAPNGRDGTYTVKTVLGEDSLEVVSATWEGNAQTTISGGGYTTTIRVTDPSGTSKINATVELADYCNIRTEADFSEASPVTCRFRVERSVTDQLLDVTDFTISGNSITVNSGITIDLSDELTGKAVSYGKVYIEYVALRTDLQLVTEVTRSTLETVLGKYDARNPLAVGATIAAANTSTPVLVYGLESDDLAGYLTFLDKLSAERDPYAIVPLTYDTSILASILSDATQHADPTYALSSGIRQKFSVVVGAVELVTEKYVVGSTGGGTTSQKSATAPSAVKKATIAQTGGAAVALYDLGIVPGDTIEVNDNGTVTEYTVAHLISDTEIETDEVLTSSGSLTTAGDYIRIPDPASPGTYKFTREVGVGSVTEVELTGAALDNLYLNIEVPSATFVQDGVIPGDVLQIPENPTVASWTTGVQSWVIDRVDSDTRLVIVNSGTNTSELANELPHGARRSDGSEIVGTGNIFVRVKRSMAKSEQIDDMVSVAASFGNKRITLVYPSSVDPTDLVDGSKTRSGTDAEPADPQPGYYLACMVGGQVAGNPSQQGFTYLGGAGISRIYNSNGYFREEQLTELSNGGVNVFIQETPASLPMSIHSVTTDVSSNNFSEFMNIKNFDYNARTYQSVIFDFLGKWNITAETIEFLSQGLQATGDSLKSRYVAKIGSPITSHNVAFVGESSISDDRLEAYVDINMPRVLNTIGLHLVG